MAWYDTDLKSLEKELLRTVLVQSTSTYKYQLELSIPLHVYFLYYDLGLRLNQQKLHQKL